jgi:hypothetical protein
MTTHRFIRHSARVAAVLGGLAFTAPSPASEPLKSVLTEEEYRQSGLSKLSEEEQTVLLQALQRRGINGTRNTQTVTGTAQAPEKKGLWARIKDFGAEQLPLKHPRDEGEVVEVVAEMTEPFRGLQGRTIFHLDNGQVWQQRIDEVYYMGKSIPNPKVIIRRTRFGYRMLISAVEPDFAVAVKRIE